MATKKPAIATTLLLIWSVIALNACGTSIGTGELAGTPGATPARSELPDRVRITNEQQLALPLPGSSTPGGAQPAVTLTDTALARQLFATTFALPALPSGRACTAELGPHYTLTFLQGTATVASVQADRDGCWPVTIAGETPIREATIDFWQQLDHAVNIATPPLNPDRLAIATTPHVGQAPQSTLITSTETAQQVYDAILALPRMNSAPSCAFEPKPAYQIVFFQGEHALPASVYDKCQTVKVDGGYQWRGGWFTTNDQFRSMLQAVLAGATFAPARPDHLAVAVGTAQTNGSYVNVSDQPLMLDLYAQVFRLSETAVQPDCPSTSDKLAGNYTFMGLTFTQWDLPLVSINTYQGSCRYVQLSGAGQRLQGNQDFWDLINRLQTP